MNLNMFLTAKENRVPLILVVVLSALTFWLYGGLCRAHRSALEGAVNAKACQELSRRIVDLKKKPELISGTMSSTAQIAQSVESAMQEAEMTAEKLIRIDPRSAIRLDQTSFLQQPSHLELREVTMEQLIRFLHILATKNRLETTDLRLHAPRTASTELGPELWNAELLLTNTIYFP